MSLIVPSARALAQPAPSSAAVAERAHAARAPDARTLEGSRQLNTRRIQTLTQQRDAIDTRAPWRRMAAGAALIIAGNALVIYAALGKSGCEERSRDLFGMRGECREAGHYDLLDWVSFSGSVGGGCLLGVALRQLIDRRREVRRLNQELDILRGLSPQVAFPTQRGGLAWGLTLRRAF